MCINRKVFRSGSIICYRIAPVEYRKIIREFFVAGMGVYPTDNSIYVILSRAPNIFSKGRNTTSLEGLPMGLSVPSILQKYSD